jgi:hypothetical protein
MDDLLFSLRTINYIFFINFQIKKCRDEFVKVGFFVRPGLKIVPLWAMCRYTLIVYEFKSLNLCDGKND